MRSQRFQEWEGPGITLLALRCRYLCARTGERPSEKFRGPPVDSQQRNGPKSNSHKQLDSTNKLNELGRRFFPKSPSKSPDGRYLEFGLEKPGAEKAAEPAGLLHCRMVRNKLFFFPPSLCFLLICYYSYKKLTSIHINVSLPQAVGSVRTGTVSLHHWVLAQFLAYSRYSKSILLEKWGNSVYLTWFMS